MAKTTINNGDTGLVVRTALNDMFTELYAILTPEIITATSGQTVVTFTTDVNTINLIWLNNSLVEKDVDYTVTGTKEVTFEYGLNANDKITKR